MSEELKDFRVARATNRAGTLSVRATDQGLPVEIEVDRAELRYGGQSLAAEIMRLCQRARIQAGVRRRDDLAGAGVPPDILDQLGLPTRATAADQLDQLDDQDVGRTDWLRRT